MGREWDVVVVGDGLAGRVAALAAAERGASVHLVADAEDASRHGAGVIDVLGYAPDGTPVADPFDAIETLPAEHPYTRFGASTVRSAMGFLGRLLEEPYVGLDAPRNELFAGPLGNPLVAYGYPCSVGAGALAREDRVLLVDVAPLSGFDSTMAARTLQEVDVPGTVEAGTIDLSDVLETGADRQWVANRLDREVATEPAERSLVPAFREALESIVPGHDRVGIPAVLGIERWPEIHRRIDSLLEPDVFEVPTGPPSVLGMRLDRALDEAVAASPVERTRGVRAIAHRATGGDVTAIEIERESSTEWLTGEQFVLATGGLLGGGLQASGSHIEEPLFGCPVDPPAAQEWTASDPFGAHPFATAGLSTDDQLRPVGADSGPVYANLRAAGDVLGRFDPVQEGSGGGVAVATGYAAGRKAAQEVDS